MSDLKLYNSINKINDALIEEAACTEKPVIHHCYGIAASAAAVFIAVGALGLFHASGSLRKTDLSTNTPVIGQNTTETVTATTTPAISDETIQTSSVETVPLTTQVPMTSAQASVSYSKTSTIPQNSQNQTSAFSAASSAAAVTSSAEYISAEMNTVSTADAETVTAVTTEAVTPYDYNYYNEGRVIMKRFAALSSALLMLPNVSAVNSGAAEPLKYTRSDKYPDNINNFITCIEEYDLNIDINGDGKFDIFDAYAVDHLYSEGCPEYIVDNINECNAKINEFISETGNYASIYDITEYFVYTQPVKLEYFDPNFYIDNCPDIYNEPIPLEYIRHDDGEFDIVDFYDTEFYEENDGTFERLKYHQSSYINKKKSPIHQFIESRLQPAMCYTNASYNIMSELMDKGMVDADINSDGVFNYDDIMMLYYFQDLFYDDYYETHYGYWDEDDEYHSLESGPIHEKNRTYEGFLENYELLSSCYPEWSYLTNHKLSESEWEKAAKFYDIESMYTLRCVADINQSLFIYYITNYNNIDPEIFNNSYYDNSPDHFLCDDLRGFFNKYKDIYETYGVNAIRSPEDKPVDPRFAKYDIETMFPEYYAAVKKGELPAPDITKDGKIDIEDYAFFQDLFSEIPAPDDPSYFSYAIIDAPQAVRDAFNNDYDFNNNGVSCDIGELECIELYIAKAMGAADYSDVYETLQKYYAEKPSLDPRVIFEERQKNMNNTETEAEKSVEREVIMNRYMSSLQLFKTVTGDANIDGAVDISDVVFIMQTLSNPDRYNLTPQGRKNADSNGDGVTNNDALTIQEYLLGSGSIE